MKRLERGLDTDGKAGVGSEIRYAGSETGPAVPAGASSRTGTSCCRLVWLMFLALMIGCGGNPDPQKVALSQQNSFDYNYRLGVMHLNQGNIPSAIMALQKALTIKPEDADGWNALGLAHFMGKQYKEALFAFQKALEVKPTFTDVHNNLGNVYNDMGLYDKAKAEYNKVLEDLTYPKPEAAYFNLATIAAVEEKYDVALNYCRLALSMNPRFARVYNLIGLINEKKGDLREAVANYRVGLTVGPEQLELNYNLAVVLFKTKQYAESRPLFEKVVQLYPATDQGKRSLEYLQMFAKPE
ncbi:MAG: tetratricopeptide repeat protein [Acidobacteriota bacterium]